MWAGVNSIKWEKISLFRELDAGELESVKPYFDIVEYEAGKRVITENESGETMYILVRGRVRVTKSMVLQGLSAPLLEADDPKKVLADVDDAQYPVFGEIAVLGRDMDKRSATVSALENCRFLTIGRERFFALVETRPAIGNRILMALGRRLAAVVRRNNDELVKLTTALALVISRKE